MAVKTPLSSRSNGGQSLIEFVFMLPVMFGMIFILIRVNSAIQVSIVNQKYSRQRLLELVGNSPHYPDVGQRLTEMVTNGINRMVVGVSEELIPDKAVDFTPSATTQVITAKKDSSGTASDAAQEEPDFRAKVRIRNTVELCTPTLSGRSLQGGLAPLSEAMSNASFDTVTFCSGGA